MNAVIGVAEVTRRRNFLCILEVESIWASTIELHTKCSLPYIDAVMCTFTYGNHSRKSNYNCFSAR